MLIPRRTKHRKQHRPDRHGKATGGTSVSFGEYGIQALEHAYVSNRQIEAARIAMTRHIRRGGKVWINIYPDRPLTKKPAEPDGLGQGLAGVVGRQRQAGRVMFGSCPVCRSRWAGRPSAGHAQAPMKCKFVTREAGSEG
jgi:large subunit ribosomal protein L16